MRVLTGKKIRNLSPDEGASGTSYFKVDYSFHNQDAKDYCRMK